MNLLQLAVDEERINSHINAPRPNGYEHAVPVDQMPSLCWYKVEALGFGTDSDAPYNERTPQEISLAAYLLASSGKPFSVLCQRSSLSEKAVFAIGSENDSLVPAVLRAAFGTVKYERLDSDSIMENGWGYCAADFKAVKTDVRELDERRRFTDIEVVPWVDEAARILMDFPGKIQLNFHPAEHRCGELLKRSQDIRNEISGYLDTNITVSENLTVNSHEDVVIETIRGLKKDEKSEVAPGTSVGWSCRDAALDRQNKEEEYYSELYHRADSGGWVIDFYVSADTGFGMHSDSRDARALSLSAVLSAAILKAGYHCSWKEVQSNGMNRGLPLTPDAAAEFISFPSLSFYGFEKRDNRYYCVNVTDHDDSIRIAQLLQYDENTGVDISLPLDQINRHVFVCGMTGSGKTNTVHQLLSNIGTLPFLVIEPVKGEYRALPGIKAYTMTAGSTDALLLNPFWFPQGSNLQYHIDCIKQIISSAFDLYAAMPNILEQCLNRVYQHCGWDLVQSSNYYKDILPEDMLYPTFSDLCREIDAYLENSKFGAETKGNYRGALLSRLQSFTSGAKGMLLNTQTHISFEDLIDSKVVISLDSLADDADKSIVMGVILTQYYQYLKLKSKSREKQGLRHITVIEEAHHLFAANSGPSVSSAEGGSGVSSSQDFVKTLNNMLAEIRAYDEGFIIVDQSPSALHPAVLKNTGVKIVHRIDYGEDIRSIQEVLLLDQDDNELAALEKGQALLRYGGMRLSAKVYVPYCEIKDHAGPVAHEDIRGNSIVNHLLEDSALNDALKPVVRQLIEQLLYDDLSNFSTAYQRFYHLIERALVIYGHNEIAVNGNSEAILSEYIKALVPDVLEKMLSSQYSTVKLICFFIGRFLMIANESENRMSAAEIYAFEDYRRYYIRTRMTRYFSASKEVKHQNTVRALGEPCPEVGLISEIVEEMLKHNITLENRMEWFETILAQRFFLVEPRTKEELFGKTIRVFDAERMRKKNP